MAIDPNCGMTVDELSALSAEDMDGLSTFASTTAGRNFFQCPLKASRSTVAQG